MRQRPSLRLSTGKKRTEETYQGYIAWGKNALKEGDPVEAENYYQHAEHWLHVLNGPDLQVIHGPVTAPSPEEGAPPSKQPNLRLIQGGLSLPALSPNVEEPAVGQLPQIVFSSQMSEEERCAIYQRMKMKARHRSQNRLNKASKRLHPYLGQNHHPLPDGEETQETPEGILG